jgi:hypothetical protein
MAPPEHLVLMNGVWLMVTGSVLALASLRYCNRDRAQSLVEENRRFFGGRLRSARMDLQQSVNQTQFMAIICVILGGVMLAVGAILAVISLVSS